MRIFLDANVLFSAAKSAGAVRHLLTTLLDSGHELWVDGYVLAEARRNLSAKAPSGVEVLETFLPRLRVGEMQLRPEELPDLPLPPKDRPVLEAAIHHGCHALMTGDRTHFGALYGRVVQGVAVHSPRSLAQAVLGGS